VQCGVGEVKDVKRLNNGSILVEAASHHHAKLLTHLDDFADILVSCCPDRSLYLSCDVFRCHELLDFQEHEIVDDLRHQGVVAAKQILSNRNGFVQQTVILTFNLHRPPASVTIAFHLEVRVQPFIPNPWCCFKCQKYGHGSKTCRKQYAVCATCGLEDHTDSETNHCISDPHCANCGGGHTASSKDCPTWLMQREITRVKFEHNCTFPEVSRTAPAYLQLLAALRPRQSP
jgi:hypothetical protein